jgi:hypothetical protein
VSISKKLLPWTVTFGLLSAVLWVSSSYMVIDIDLYHEMALYRQYLQEGAMPLQDDFAYTPTIERVVHHEWATGAVLYWVTVASGWGTTGLILLKYALAFSICFGCYFYSRWRGVSLAVFSVLALLPLYQAGWFSFTNVRAQVFTLLFLVILFWFLELDRRGKRWWIWFWLPLFVVWANMHAGVVSGMGILGVYGVSRLIDEIKETRSFGQALLRVKHLLFVGVATALLINVNPYGFEYVPYLIRAIRLERPLISEWSTIWKAGSTAMQATYLTTLVVAAYAIINRGGKDTFEIMALALTAYLAMKHIRHGSLYAVTWVCLVPPLLEPSKAGAGIREMFASRRAQIATVALALGLVAMGSAINAKFWHLSIPTEKVVRGMALPVFPAGAVEFIRQQNFQGNLYVPFMTGAYVSWHLYPDVKVSIDSRYEVAYPPGAVEESWKFYLGRAGWQQTLAKYDTDGVLAPVNSKLFKKMEQAISENPDFGWKLVYKDNGHALFFRDEVYRQVSQSDRSGKRVKGIFP